MDERVRDLARPAGSSRRIVRAVAGTIAALAFGSVSTLGQEAGGACRACHLTLDEPALAAPATAYANDVHFGAGLACTGCHGGDAVATVEAIAHAGMRASPSRDAIPGLCGRCHSNPDFMHAYDPGIRVDQVESYYTSRHGQGLREGDTRVAVCNDCHLTHEIMPPDDDRSTTHPLNIPDLCGSCHADADRMAPYGVAVDQLDEYRTSVHWATLTEEGDLSAPVCNDCHGNHGAVPPGYASVGRVCAECHFQIGEYYALSPHDSVFVGLDRPGCATCHSNHAILQADDELLGLGDRTTCYGAGCHTDQDVGGQTAVGMRVLIDSLLTAHARADSILEAAALAGMHVEQPQFELTQVQNAIVSARAVLHTASLDSVRHKVDEGLEYAVEGFQSGEEAFAELVVRRVGLAVSTVFVLILVGGLLVRIRDLPPVETKRSE